MSVGKKPRKPMPPRKAPLRSSGRIAPRARTKAEQDEKFEREYGGTRRLDWIQGQGCLACGASPSEAAHAKGDGTSRKGAAKYTVPLCHYHHIEDLHRHGVQTFERAHEGRLLGLSLVQWAAGYERAWQLFQSQPEHIGAIVPRVVADLTTGSD